MFRKTIITHKQKKPNALRKPYLSHEVEMVTLYVNDESLVTGDINADKKSFTHYDYIDFYGFRRTYGRKGSCRGVMTDKVTRLGHVDDYPEYRFRRNKRFDSLWDIWDRNSYAYKRTVSWKFNSKRSHQWIGE
ncbi:hypothetical protein LMH73_013145 [Vibrio splendidus]|nr:hypothetical protein [Vibrio splendidus]MCC4880710.1 hypothetical protein [Vibrio splendidus]